MVFCPTYEMLCLTAGAFPVLRIFMHGPRATEKGACDLRRQRQLMKWAERSVLPEPLSTNSTSRLWIDFGCNHCHNSIVFLLTLANLYLLGGRLPGTEIESIQLS